MPTCLECFCNSGLEGRELQKHVDNNHPDFVCESSHCSPHSPGPVHNVEELAFILIHPLHYDEERDIVIPSAFQELTSRELSTLRVGMATKNEAESTRDQLVQRGKDKIPPQVRLVNEVCIAKVADIRDCLDAGRRTMAVYDTALEQVQSHASVFTRADILESREIRKRIRSQIHEAFTKHRITYANFVMGLAD